MSTKNKIIAVETGLILIWVFLFYKIFKNSSFGIGLSSGTGTPDKDGKVGGNSTVDTGQSGSGTGGYPPRVKSSPYFDLSEYITVYPPPGSNKLILNYNRLISSLNVIREKFGSKIVIALGYQPDDSRIHFRECRGVVIYAENGNNQELYNVIADLKNSKKIESGRVSIVNDSVVHYLID